MIPATPSERLLFKQRLKAHCLAVIQLRIDDARTAMQQAQESANNEDKSSAGDKYETGRAMSQIERDNAAYQLSVAMQDMILLRTIDADRLYEQADNGAVIQSADACYFISTGLGVFTFEEVKVIALSPRAPLSTAIRGKVKGDTLSLNGKAIAITAIF